MKQLKTRTVGTRLPDSVVDRVIQYALAHDISVSKAIALLVEQALTNKV